MTCVVNVLEDWQNGFGGQSVSNAQKVHRRNNQVELRSVSDEFADSISA